MRSVTQVPVAEAHLCAMVRRGFGPDAKVSEQVELTDGTYNAAYRVLLADGEDLVLKVAPPADLDRLTHEVRLMHTEVEFYRKASAAGVPVPAVRFADFSRDLLDRDYVFLQRVPGQALNAGELTAGDLATVRRELGAAVARLHTVTGSRYGYPLRDSATWQPTWARAYYAMVEDVLADAVRLGTELPAAPAEITARLHRHAAVLDAVDQPALVHFDLWDGNIFVRRTDQGAHLSGLIDGERAFYGDPYAEFVSLALFRDVTELPELLDGYAAASGRPVEVTAAVRTRIALYTCYLYLIMVTEGPTRGFDPDDPTRRYALRLLGEQLGRL